MDYREDGLRKASSFFFIVKESIEFIKNHVK